MILLAGMMLLIAGCQTSQILEGMADSLANGIDRGAERVVLCVTKSHAAPEGYRCGPG
jgi:hypothetical protein